MNCKVPQSCIKFFWAVQADKELPGAIEKIAFDLGFG